MDNTIAGITRYLAYDVDSLNTVSQNVANLRTPGYRSEQVVRNFASALPESTVALDMTAGALEQTGRPLDLALQGNAFFTVDAGGSTLLLRAGQLGVDSQGRLVDPAGHPVLGQSGPITVSGSDVTVRADGAVMQGTRMIDRLQIVDVMQPELLRDVGGGLYAYAGSLQASTAGIRSGALEQSNVDPGREMVQLMQITRHAQSLQHAMAAYDQVLQAGINQIGKNS